MRTDDYPPERLGPYRCIMCGMTEADCNAGLQPPPGALARAEFYPCAHEFVTRRMEGGPPMPSILDYKR